MVVVMEMLHPHPYLSMAHFLCMTSTSLCFLSTTKSPSSLWVSGFFLQVKKETVQENLQVWKTLKTLNSLSKEKVLSLVSRLLEGSSVNDEVFVCV